MTGHELYDVILAYSGYDGGGFDGDGYCPFCEGFFDDHEQTCLWQRIRKGEQLRSDMPTG